MKRFCMILAGLFAVASMSGCVWLPPPHHGHGGYHAPRGGYHGGHMGPRGGYHMAPGFHHGGRR